MILKSVFLIMVFSIFTACIPETDDSPDLEHSSHCELFNSCSGTVYFQQTIKNWYYENNIKKYHKKAGIKYRIQQNDKYIFDHRIYNFTKEAYFSTYDEDDTVWIYINDKVILFTGPMIHKMKSEHDFFNLNSWDSVAHPLSNDEHILRFTLTDKDFEQ